MEYWLRMNTMPAKTAHFPTMGFREAPPSMLSQFAFALFNGGNQALHISAQQIDSGAQVAYEETPSMTMPLGRWIKFEIDVDLTDAATQPAVMSAKLDGADVGMPTDGAFIRNVTTPSSLGFTVGALYSSAGAGGASYLVDDVIITGSD
ncbi:MAG TPA: hypothetical protein VGM90_19575 [Kofleriaceae bacterium]|jgi:hypothetical protein